ncbi:MAG: hypothetical protein ACK4YO_00880, partial [Candidatus Altarchaeaceae archaeon]
FKNKTIISFPYKFIGITGPNGSGKSNLVDAIIFALGRSRGLRVDKVSDLLSTIGDKKAEKAIVTLYFSDEDNKDKNLKITRIIDITGKSIYKINDRVSTKEKISEIFGDSSYNILLQNDIAKFIEMNPKERRKIIDEICGISEYDEKKENAIKELSVVETKISETNIMLNEKSIFLQKLEKEKNDALRYKLANKTLRYIEKILDERKLKKEKENFERIIKEKERLKEEKERNENEIKNLNIEKNENEKKISEINKKIFELQNEKISLGGISASENQKILRNLKKSLQNIDEQIKENINKQDEENNKIKTLNERSEKILQEINIIDKKIKEFKYKEISEKIEEINKKIYEIKINIEKINQRKESIMNEKYEILEKIKENDNEISEILNKEIKYAREIDDKNFAYKSIYEQIEKKRKLRLKAEQEYENLANEYDKLKEEYIYKKEILKNYSEDPILNFLRKALDGIYGKVSEIIRIPDKRYSKAVYSAGGNRMENIVVEDVETAIKCINLIKKNKLGKATFLPLDKIKVDSKPRDENVVPIKNFVTVPLEKFEKIIDYVFGDTIVVNSVEEFKNYINKYRIVSIDGDLAEKSGAITGGYIKERINYEEIKEEVQEIERKIKNMEKNLMDLKEKIKERDEELERKLQNLAIEIEKLKIEKNNLKERREELKKENENLKKRIENLEDELKKIEEEEKNLRNLLTNLEKDNKKLTDELKGKGYEEIERLKDEKRNKEIERGIILANIKTSEETLLKLKEEYKKLMKEKESYEKEIENLTKEIEEIKAKIIENQNRIKKIDEEIYKYEEERSKIEKRNAEINLKIQDLTNRNEEIRNNLEKILIEEIQSKNIIETLSNKIKEYEIDDVDKNFENFEDEELYKKLEELKKEISDLGEINLKAIDDYEKAKKEYDEVYGKIEKLKEEKQAIYDFISNVEKKRREIFMEAYETIKKGFEEIFKKLTDGYGTLTLDNPKEISESGLLIHACPKGKNIKILDSMSGGEKTLTTLAFLLAIQKYKPSIFYIFDELDASLDEENAERFAKIIKESEGQVIIVSHNEHVLQYCDGIIGIAMKDGCSKVVSVELKK